MAAMTEWERIKREQGRAAAAAVPVTSDPPVEPSPPRTSRSEGGFRWSGRFGLLAKIMAFLLLILVPLAALTWTISVQSLRTNLTEEFTSKGSAIARGLANTAVDLVLTRDASTVQAQVDQVAGISGVAYVMVYDQQKTLIAHTFAPLVPPGLVDKKIGRASCRERVL